MQFVAPPNSQLANVALELRHACESVTRLLDFFTGKFESHQAPAIEDDQLLTGLVNTNDVEGCRILVADDNRILIEDDVVVVEDNGTLVEDDLTVIKDDQTIVEDVRTVVEDDTRYRDPGN